MRLILVSVVFLFLFLSFGCKQAQSSAKNMDMVSYKKGDRRIKGNTLDNKRFDTLVDGSQIKLYWLKNAKLKMAITNYGGRVVGLYVPDKNGDVTDVSIGRSSINEYLDSDEAYFGALIGRVGNRIAKGQFSLDGVNYSIPTNNNENTLHGGYKGFQDAVWTAEKLNDQSLSLTYLSKDMEEGFPGNLTVNVLYTLTQDNTLKINYHAVTDKATVVNLTNHTYFNLNGEGSGTILNHRLQIFSQSFTPVDKGLIPTGELRSVKGTPLDFTKPIAIGERIDSEYEQLSFGAGYDHNYVLNESVNDGLVHAAKVVGDKSGIIMDVYTKEPGLQFYSGNFMAGKNLLKSGSKDAFRTAFCLETQHFPDAPNHANFPSIRLDPGDTYETATEYRFSTE